MKAPIHDPVKKLFSGDIIRTRLTAVTHDMTSFSVLTLNLWNINEPIETRFDALERGLKRLTPDIVCLQEVAREPQSGKSQADRVAEMCNHAHVAEDNGLAITSSIALGPSTCVPLPEFPGDFPRSSLSIEIVIDGRPLLVTNTHLAYPPEMNQERKSQVDVLLAAIAHRCSTATGLAKVLCGDFNDTETSPAVRAVLDSDLHFCDVFAECHPGSPGFTYSTRNKYVDPSWTLDERIDYIFASPDIVRTCCSVVFDGSTGFDLVSDHFGVFCKLAFKP
jgi:endonuclease/exonuclease/phosphatase family metal-dependent hydrolase